MKSKQFPKFYRFITERSLIFILLLSFLLVVIVLIGLDLKSNLQNKILIDKQNQEIKSQVQYWENIIGKYKGYRDGYFELSVLNYQLKNTEKARMYLKEALRLDPNFEPGKELEKILTNN